MQSRPTKIIIVLALAIIALAGVWYLHAKRSEATTYTEPSLGVSFTIPAGYHVHRELSDLGETLFVLAPNGSNIFQIFVRSFNDEGKPITALLVNQEVGYAVANDAPITVGGIAQGLQFDSISDAPATHLVWFAYNGYLYEAQAFSNNTDLLRNILASWRFTQQ
jgi:RsiW-degrading membrane proteinase PrsW (M82 family)